MEEVQHVDNLSIRTKSISDETLQVIVENVPQSKEVLQLYRQLRQSLPILNFEKLENSGDLNGMIEFRDLRIPIELLKDFIPAFIFPINDEKTLIERLSHLVQVIPPFVGFDASKIENIQYISQVNFLNSFKDWLKKYSVPVVEYMKENRDG